MANQHPISPPQELRDKWLDEAPDNSVYDYLIDKSSQWGADQEREACCEWLNYNYPSVSTRHLRDARRPKALSLKERALDDLKAMTTVPPGMSPLAPETVERIERIRRALEELPDD